MDDYRMRQVNEAIALVTGTLTIVMLLRITLGPDYLVRIRLRTLRTISRTSKAGADALSTIAADADTTYHRLLNVTV